MQISIQLQDKCEKRSNMNYNIGMYSSLECQYTSTDCQRSNGVVSNDIHKKYGYGGRRKLSYVSTSLFYGREENAVTSIFGKFGGRNSSDVLCCTNKR